MTADMTLCRLVRDGQRSTSQPAPGSTWAAGRRVRIVSTCYILTMLTIIHTPHCPSWHI